MLKTPNNFESSDNECYICLGHSDNLINPYTCKYVHLYCLTEYLKLIIEKRPL